MWTVVTDQQCVATYLVVLSNVREDSFKSSNFKVDAFICLPREVCIKILVLFFFLKLVLAAFSKKFIVNGLYLIKGIKRQLAADTKQHLT